MSNYKWKDDKRFRQEMEEHPANSPQWRRYLKMLNARVDWGATTTTTSTTTTP